MAGFEVSIYGRFWVSTEAASAFVILQALVAVAHFLGSIANGLIRSITNLEVCRLIYHERANIVEKSA